MWESHLRTEANVRHSHGNNQVEHDNKMVYMCQETIRQMSFAHSPNSGAYSYRFAHGPIFTDLPSFLLIRDVLIILAKFAWKFRQFRVLYQYHLRFSQGSLETKCVLISAVSLENRCSATLGPEVMLRDLRIKRKAHVAYKPLALTIQTWFVHLARPVAGEVVVVVVVVIV